MRRPALLVLLVLATAPLGGAQTLAEAEAQFGLSVGTVWEYARTEGVPWDDDVRVVGHERWEIVGLDDPEGERRFVLEGGRLSEPVRRCDLTASARPNRLVLGVSGPCTFGDLGLLDVEGTERAYVVRPGHDGCFDLGNPWDPEAEGVLCGTGSEGGEESRGTVGGVYVHEIRAAWAVSGFGLADAFVYRDSTSSDDRLSGTSTEMRYLTYVQVGGVEYGTARPVARAERPQSAGPLRVGPNPARGAATVWAEARGTLALVDALGREVRRHGVAGPGPVRLALDGLPPGTYTARLVTADGVRSARLAVVR